MTVQQGLGYAVCLAGVPAAPDCPCTSSSSTYQAMWLAQANGHAAASYGPAAWPRTAKGGPTWWHGPLRIRGTSYPALCRPTYSRELRQTVWSTSASAEAQAGQSALVA